MTDNYIGRSIEMGRYQKPGRKKDYEPIVWKILDVIDDKALIWSEKLLVQKPFNEEESANVTWQNSSLREWLNKAFIQTAFTKEEFDKLIPNADGDWIFILSREEIEKYTSDKEEYNEQRMIEIPSRTAGILGKKKSSRDEYWWVKDIQSISERFGSLAYHIDHHGYYGSTPTYCDRWVRPACIVRLSDV